MNKVNYPNASVDVYTKKSKANPRADTRLTHVRLGIFFPHEIAASFYNFRSGDLFYSLLTGTPEDTHLQS